MIWTLNKTGPYIVPQGRCGYGLVADKDYAPGEAITQMGGKWTSKSHGDYVYYIGDGQHMDAELEFSANKKGRWINEDRHFPNVILGRTIRARRFIKKGEFFMADYGNDYQRNYSDNVVDEKTYQRIVWIQCIQSCWSGDWKACGKPGWGIEFQFGNRYVPAPVCNDCMYKQCPELGRFPLFTRHNLEYDENEYYRVPLYYWFK